MIARFLVGLSLTLLTTCSLLADDPKFPDAKAYDKLVVDALRDVHNKAADLYNERRDFAGAYRMFQGAALTVRPLLAHQPTAQKLIDDGLAEAEKEPFTALKAYKLHETIENVREFLKTGVVPAKAEEKKPVVKKPAEPTESSKKTIDRKPIPSPEAKKPPEKIQPVTYELAPPPREKK